MRIAAAALLWLALTGCQKREPPPAEARPPLALLTSLPIAFGEEFTLEGPKPPLLARLEQDYEVVPVDGPEQLRPSSLLLAIQPQALTAERLVALDKWVRDGGRVVLLADPALAFESSRPLGDRFRPPFQFPDTGLLRHWGVGLQGPAGNQPGEAELVLGPALAVRSRTVGRFDIAGGTCRGAEAGGSSATVRCPIGKGRAVLVADADFAMSPREEDREALLALVDELRR